MEVWTAEGRCQPNPSPASTFGEVQENKHRGTALLGTYCQLTPCTESGSEGGEGAMLLLPVDRGNCWMKGWASGSCRLIEHAHSLPQRGSEAEIQGV